MPHCCDACAPIPLLLLLRLQLRIAFSCLSVFAPGAHEPLIQVFALANAHHLLLEAEVGPGQHRLQFALGTATVRVHYELVELLVSARGDTVRVPEHRRVLIDQHSLLVVVGVGLELHHHHMLVHHRPATVLGRAWTDTASAAYLLFELLLYLFLLGQAKRASPALEGKLKSRLLYCLLGLVLILCISCDNRVCNDLFAATHLLNRLMVLLALGASGWKRGRDSPSAREPSYHQARGREVLRVLLRLLLSIFTPGAFLLRGLGYTSGCSVWGIAATWTCFESLYVLHYAMSGHFFGEFVLGFLLAELHHGSLAF